MTSQPSNGSVRDRVIKALRCVHDPEIPVNIYDLGLIYEIRLSDRGDVKVVMTLTAPNCPVADRIPTEVSEAVRSVDGVTNVDVSLVWEPAWNTDRMSEIARLELEAMGISPDRAKESSTSRTTGLTIGRKRPGRE